MEAGVDALFHLLGEFVDCQHVSVARANFSDKLVDISVLLSMCYLKEGDLALSKEGCCIGAEVWSNLTLGVTGGRILC